MESQRAMRVSQGECAMAKGQVKLKKNNKPKLTTKQKQEKKKAKKAAR